MDIINKYSPKTLDEFIGNEESVKILKENTFKNIILHGDYGSGKTKLIEIFVKTNNIKNKDIIHLNINEDLNKKNLQTSSLFDFMKRSTKTYIIIDTYEIPTNKQYILKSIIKNKNKNTSFIFCLNNISNLIEQIIPHFQVLTLNYEEEKYYNHFIDIVGKEKLKINKKIIKYITEKSLNFREIENKLLKILYLDSNKDCKNVLNISNKETVSKMILLCYNKKIKEIYKLLPKLLNSYSSLNIFNMISLNINNIDELPYNMKIKYIHIISKYQIESTSEYSNSTVQLYGLFAKLCLSNS